MRTVSFANLKGGVGKTTSALNFSFLLADTYCYKVLLVDNDPQGNSSKFMDRHSYENKSIEDILNGSENIKNVIRNTYNDKINIISSNMNMDNACKTLLLNNDEEQHTKLKNALIQVADKYDYCVIDCQPGMGINTINALVASDDVIVPVRIDCHAIDGVVEFSQFIEEIREYNSSLKIVKCLITAFQKDPYSIEGKEFLRGKYDLMDASIRFSNKVIGWTFECATGLCEYSPRCAAAIDYKKFVNEYLELVKAGD